MFNLFTRFGLVIALLGCQPVAAEGITKGLILEVIEVTDQAAVDKDVDTIGNYLASDFYKFVDVPSAKPPVTVRLDKQQYLEMIEQGWEQVTDYDYQRSDIVINVTKDGEMGESNSTILESLTMDGRKMISKVREYATYKLENGKPVIIMIDSHRLVGDSSL